MHVHATSFEQDLPQKNIGLQPRTNRHGIHVCIISVCLQDTNNTNPISVCLQETNNINPSRLLKVLPVLPLVPVVPLVPIQGYPTDLSDAAAVTATIQDIQRDLGPVSLLFWNPVAPPAALPTATPEQLTGAFTVTVTGEHCCGRLLQTLQRTLVT